MSTSLNQFVNDDAKAYFLIFKTSKGSRPVIQQWALNKLFRSMHDWIDYIAKCISQKDLSLIIKTDFSNKLDKLNKKNRLPDYEDAYQNVSLALLYVLRKHNYASIDLKDYLYFVVRELFGDKWHSINSMRNRV